MGRKGEHRQLVLSVRSLTGRNVIAVLEKIAMRRGYPTAIVSDNGPEFCSRVVDEWAHRVGIKLQFIRPGKPVDNCYMESFNGKFRDECLNENWFKDRVETR